MDYYCFNKFKVGNLTIRNITLNQSDIVSFDNNQYGVPLEIGKIFFENVTFDVESSDGSISHTIIGNNTVIGSIEYNGCNFIGNKEYLTQNGILVDSRSPNEVDITVEGCTFINIGYNAVQISGTGSNYAGNISLMGNTVDTTGDRAFRISKVSDASKINIYNNTLIGCEDELFSAFKVEAEKGNIQSSGNTLNGQPFGIIEAVIGDINSPNYLYNNSIDDILTEIGDINSISFNSDYFTSDLITIEALKDISIIGKPGCLLNGLKINGNGYKVTISGINSVGAGILVKSANNVNISNCVITSLGEVEDDLKNFAGHFAGIGIDSFSGDITLTNNKVISNDGESNNDIRYGISICRSTGNNGKIEITGNEISDIAYSALFIQNVKRTATISGNTFEEWNCNNKLEDAGRAIRLNNVDVVSVTNNEFIKDFGTRSYADVGSLMKCDYNAGKPGNVTFEDNKLNGTSIAIAEKDRSVPKGEGVFFDKGICFDHDSESTIPIGLGECFWEDVTISGNMDQGIIDVSIYVYGELVIQKTGSLNVTGIHMIDGSKLDNYGTLVVESISNVTSSDVIFRAGSSVQYGKATELEEISSDSRLESDGNIVGFVDTDTDKFVSKDGEVLIDIGTQSSVTMEDELTVELAVNAAGNAEYKVVFPAGTVILKDAEVLIKGTTSKLDPSMIAFEVHFDNIETNGEIIQVTLPTLGVSNPYVFFIDGDEFILMETVGEPGDTITFETTHNSTYAIISADDVLDYGYPSEESSNGIDVNIIYIVEIVLIALALIGLAAVIRRN